MIPYLRLEQYRKDIQIYGNRDIKLAENNQRTIESFQIGSGLKNLLPYPVSIEIGPEYEIKFIFYANDNTKSSVVIRGKNFIINYTSALPGTNKEAIFSHNNRLK